MVNNIEILNISYNNNNIYPDFGIISQYNWVIYITEFICIARFWSLINIFTIA